jgi:hypothetical protein
MNFRRKLCGTMLMAMSIAAPAQICTTQAKMPTATRTALADAALLLGNAVKAGDANAVKASTMAAYAANFGPIEYAIQSTSEKLHGDSLRVTQVYLLDATSRKPGDTSDADFTCALQNTASETDFSIGALPPGMYAFAMVEATGDRPWLLSFILQQDGSAWKMAGFYPHARTAAGKDGLWYWNTARAKVAAKQPWLAWLDYSEADALLAPASFASSTALDKLHAEQQRSAPADLANGLSADTPLILKSSDGKDFHVTSVANETADDGTSLHLVLHYAADVSATPEASRARNALAAKAFLTAHPELRPAYTAVIVFADIPGQNPVVVSLPMAQI